MARYPRRFGSPAARAQSRAAFTALGGFLPVLGAALSSVIESNTVTLSGLVGSPALTISGGQYSKNGAAYSSAATTVTNGDTLKLRVTSSGTAGATASAVATIDGAPRTFSVTTAAADTGTPTPTPGPTLSISGTPAPASVGSSDTFTPTISGGTTPYTLSLLSGNLPPGRTINGSARTVTGAYTTAGTYNYVLRATDSVGATADLTVNLTVSAAGMTDNIIVANRLAYPDSSVSLNSTNTARRQHRSSPQGPITNLRPVFVWNFLVSGGTINGGAAASLKHALEYPQNVIHPTTFSGGRILTTAANTTYVADPVLDSRTGNLLRIVLDDFWERTAYISTSSRAFPAISHAASVSALGISDGKIAGDSVDSGTIPADTSSQISWGMAALIGTVEATGAICVISFGDSLNVGQGDGTGVGIYGSSGMVARKVDASYPHMRVARGGFKAQDFAAIISGVAFPNFLAALNLSNGSTRLVVQPGLNDLSLGSRSRTDVMNDRQTIINAAAAKIPGLVPVHTTITPRVETTDGYMSVAGQTPKADGTMSELTPLNALIRAKPLVMDYADAAMSARDSNVFSGPFPPTDDGTHMLTPKVAAVASAVNMPF